MSRAASPQAVAWLVEKLFTMRQRGDMLRLVESQALHIIVSTNSKDYCIRSFLLICQVLSFEIKEDITDILKEELYE